MSAPVGEDDEAATSVSERALWAAFRGQGDRHARESLILHHLAFARILAAKLFARRVADDVVFDDFLQFASVGMVEAIDRYDPEAGASFRTFAAHRIQGAILTGVEALTERQRQLALRRTLKRERLQSLARSDGETSGDDTFSRLASMAVGLALGFMLEDLGMVQTDSASYGDNSYAGLEARQSRKELLRAVDALPEREAKIIRHHYLQQVPFDDIAVSLGLTKGRVSQLHRRALQSLLRMLQDGGRCQLSA